MAKNSKTPAAKNASDNALVTADLFTDFVDAGFEEAGEHSYAIPFLRIIQSNSPQVDETKPEFNKDAKAGMFLNTVSNEFVSGREEGCQFISCYHNVRFIRWSPRGSDGGYKGEYTSAELGGLLSSEEVSKVDGRIYFKNDRGEIDIGTDKRPGTSDRLEETHNHYGLFITPNGAVNKVLYPVSSTQIKKSRRLITMLSEKYQKTPNGQQRLPLFAHRLDITTQPESNDQGSWYGIKFAYAGLIEDPELVRFAVDFYKLCRAGKVEVQRENDSAPESADASSVHGEEDDF